MLQTWRSVYQYHRKYHTYLRNVYQTIWIKGTALKQNWKKNLLLVERGLKLKIKKKHRNVHMRWTMFYFIHTVKEIIMHLTPTYYRIWRVVGYHTVNQTIYTIIFNVYLIKWCVLSYSTGLLINLKDIVFYVGERIE